MQQGVPTECCSRSPLPSGTGGLAWRMDEDLTDATTKRQYAAIEELPHLRRFTEAELRLRSIVLGSPQVLHLGSHSVLMLHLHGGCCHMYSSNTTRYTVSFRKRSLLSSQ
jgi:hypothetical protein